MFLVNSLAFLLSYFNSYYAMLIARGMNAVPTKRGEECNGKTYGVIRTKTRSYSK